MTSLAFSISYHVFKIQILFCILNFLPILKTIHDTRHRVRQGSAPNIVLNTMCMVTYVVLMHVILV